MQRRAQWLLGCCIGAAIQFAGAPIGLAADRTVCPICAHGGQADATYSTKAGHTLVRGAANTLLGWTDLIREPAQEAKRGGNILTGLSRGMGQGIQRTVSGVAEVLTFWTPKVKGKYIEFSQDCPVCAGKLNAASHSPAP